MPWGMRTLPLETSTDSMHWGEFGGKAGERPWPHHTSLVVHTSASMRWSFSGP